jgi:hypothetical protein
MNKQKDFWVTNISSRNVSLADLNLTIKAYSSVNLLDTKHYDYTLQQLEQSKSSGSIAAKKDKIKVCPGAPQVTKMNVPFIQETYIPSRERSTYIIKEEYYEELNLSDEQFAEENAEIAEQDRQPLVIKDRTNVPTKTLR